MKRRLIFILSIVLLSNVITGCSSITEIAKSKLGDYCLEYSGIMDDEHYVQYQDMKNEGKLTDNGISLEAEDILNEETIDEERLGQVFVTFSNNEYLDISYYTDEGKQNQVTGSCYMNPNDSLYATVELKPNVKSNLYKFDGYRIYSYDEKSGLTMLDWQEYSDDCVFQIPMDFKGTDITVVPIGKYEDREIRLKDYLLDDDGNEVDVAGEWLVNDDSTNGNSIKVNPVSSYRVSYKFDGDKYFLVRANPQERYNDEDGVYFGQENSQSTISEYQVEIHPYISIVLTVDQDCTYSINDNTEISVDKGKKTTINGLKYNDKIIVKASKAANLKCEQQDNISDFEEAEVDNEYTYTFSIKEKNASFYFEPSKYTYEHGTLKFKCRGQIITEPTYIGEGSQIDFEVDTVEDGYWLPDGNHSIVVGNEKNTKKELNSIQFYPMKEVTVTLAQPEYGGTIIYKLDGKEIEQSSVTVYAGTEISMDFVHWEGWIRKVPDGTTYKATEDLNQTSTVILDNTKIEVDNVFNEKDTHKPNLTVVLNKSVGTAIDVSVSPSGNTNSDIKYQDTALKNNYKKEFGKIGTEKGVAISFSNDSVRSGQALKIVTNKIYQDSKETVQETKYVTQIPTTEKFDIYSDKEIATSNVYYEDIEITVSLVDVITYEPINIDNAKISLEYKDTETLLKAGDLIDDDREVVVRITPDNGYYLSGSKNISDGVYENTMTFKKYTSDIDKILGKDHQIKKIYTITLNDEDNYGKVTYKLNGTEVSGSIKVKEGDKLEIGYEITDNNYEVDNSGIFSFTKNKNKKSITITISSDHNGKTINRADYIDVKKK